MGQCASFKDHHGRILGYTVLDDMSQGTGYELLRHYELTHQCLADYAGFNGVSSRYYSTNLVMDGSMSDGWCKSDNDACWTEALYQEKDAPGPHDPTHCWFQGTNSELHGYERTKLCYILPPERNGNGLCSTIDGSIVPMYFLPYIIGLVVLILLCVNIILW
eukprot:974087_1